MRIIMKNIFYAAFAAIVLLAGCTKNQNEPAETKLNVVFSVADKAEFGADTKALKQGWDINDEILILFEIQGDLVDPATNSNTVSLNYAGDEWYVSNVASDLMESLNGFEEGTYMAVHHLGTVFMGAKTEGVYEFMKYKGGEYLTYRGDWKLEGDKLDLGQIKMTRPSDIFQISVEHLAKESGDWTLSILNNYTDDNSYVQIEALSADSGLCLKPYQGDLYIKTQQAAFESPGVVIGEDVVFTFLYNGPSPNVDDFKFVLSDGTNEYRSLLTATEGLLQGGKAYLMPSLDQPGFWQ